MSVRPGIVEEKGLRSVPVVEVAGRPFVGDATSAELSAFLADAGASSDGTPR